MHRHAVVAVFQTKPISLLVVDMPVGSVTAELSNFAPQVTVGVPLAAVNEIQSFWPFTGVPLKFVVIEVMLTLCPVTITIS